MNLKNSVIRFKYSGQLTFLSLLCIFLTSVSFEAIGSDTGTAIAKFFDLPGGVEQKYRAQLVSVEQSEPEVATVLKKVMPLIDYDELARRMGLVMDRYLENEDMLRFNAFMLSPSGKRAAQMYREYKNPPDLIRALNTLPPRDKAFFETTTMQKSVAALKAPEMKQAGIQYFEELFCSWARQADNKDFLARMNRGGKCIG